MRTQIAAFVRLSRPRFLVESMLTVTLGISISVYCGKDFRLGAWLLVQLTVVTTHLMTHYCNEYFDLTADSAHTAPNRWTGGSQVLVRGELRPVVSLSAAFVLLFAVVLLTLLMPTTPQRIISLAGIALAWFYTAPPIRLNYRAFGEVTTSATLTLACPLLASYAQLGYVPPLLPAICVPLFLVMTARMMVMNFCDRDSDLVVGKRTLPNALGPRRAALLLAGLQALAYVIVLVLTLSEVLPAPVSAGLAITAPVAFLLSYRVLNEPPSPDAPEHATVTAHLATVHAAATGLVVIAGLLVAAWMAHGLTSSLVACVVLFALYLGLSGGVQVMDALGRNRTARSGAIGALR